VLYETLRFRPIADSLPHMTEGENNIGGIVIPNGSAIQGNKTVEHGKKFVILKICHIASITAVTLNPENFKNPNEFVPDRFLQDGKFVSNPHVCVFSVGTRNCIGSQLAKQEYTTFAADIIRNFEIEVQSGTMEPAKHSSVLMAKDDVRIRFVPREII